MNPETFDFNIDNYSITDLENFLNLNSDYTNEDVNQKSNDFSNKINTMPNPEFKNKLTGFISQVVNILTTPNNKNKLTSAGSTFIINDDKDPTTNYVQQVYQTDIAKGSITILKKKSTITCFCINTLFRDTSSNSATDCIYYLPYVMNNVTSIEVISVELPQSIYLFSKRLSSNTIYFKEYSGFTPTTPLEGLVIFPEGNYPTSSSSSLPDIATMMTNAINTQLGTGTRFTVSIDLATNKITITNSTYIFEMYIVYPGTNKNIHRTMGWTLGFRQPSYVNELSYTTESIYNITPTEYLYLEINDFNVSQSASKVFGLFSNSYLDKNILAKLDYTSSTNYLSYNTISYDKDYLLGGLREYYGPTHLQKFYIRLLDKYGSIVDLNGMDFSFTLQLKILYEL
jgi:hypothetical protein